MATFTSELNDAEAGRRNTELINSVLSEKVTWPVIAIILAITAVWIAFGRFQSSQHADTLVPVLVSLQHWTPYFWQADRFGMLIPLLAIPIRSPLTNMMVQSTLGVFASMIAGFFIVRYFFDGSPVWLIAAALQNIWFLLLVSKAVQFEWFVDTPYSCSLLLGFAALMLVRSGRWGFGLVSMLFSTWVNSGVFIILIPIVLLRHIISKEKRGLAAELAVALVGAIAGLLAKNLSGAPRTTTSLDPISVWPAAWLQLLHLTRHAVVTNPWLLLWVIIPATLGSAALVFSRCRKYPLLVSASLILVGIISWMVFGAMVWVRLNLYNPRYVFSSLFLFAMAMAILAVSPLQNAALHYSRIVAVAMTAAIFVVGASLYGRPSRREVQRIFDQRYGSFASEVVQSHATVVAGNYWTVWPVVFDANLMLFRRRESRVIYGLTTGAKPTMLDWALERSVCAAAPLKDPEAEYWLNSSPRLFKYIGQMHSMKLYCEQ